MERLPENVSIEEDDLDFCGNCAIKLEHEPPQAYANFPMKAPLYPCDDSDSISVGKAISTIFGTKAMTEDLETVILCYDCTSILQQLYTIWQAFQVKSNPSATLRLVRTSDSDCFSETGSNISRRDIIMQKKRLKARIARRPCKARQNGFELAELSNWEDSQSDHTGGTSHQPSTTTESMIIFADEIHEYENENSGIENKDFLQPMIDPTVFLGEDMEQNHDPIDAAFNPNQIFGEFGGQEQSNSVPLDHPKRKRGRPKKGEERSNSSYKQKGTPQIRRHFESSRSAVFTKRQKLSSSNVTGPAKRKRDRPKNTDVKELPARPRNSVLKEVPASQVAAAEFEGIFPDYSDVSDSELEEGNDGTEDEQKKSKRSKHPINSQKFKIQRDKVEAARELASTGQISKPYVCKKCGRRFVNKPSLTRHVNLVHLKIKGPFLCPIEDCAHKTDFKGRVALEEHLNIHMGLKSVICDQCGMSFISKNRLKVHMVVHLKPEEKERLKTKVCHICGAKFIRSKCLAKHMMVHAEEKPWSCSEEGCQQTFKYRFTLKRHMQAFHSNEKQLTPCSRCGKEFYSKWNLHLHMKVHEKYDLTGAMMPVRAGWRKQVVRNVAKATGPYRGNATEPISQGRRYDANVTDGLRYCCTFENCERRFPNNAALDTHINRHLGLKPFSCDKCEWKFACKDALGVHMRVHLEPEAKESLKTKECPTCGAKSITEQALRKHMMVHVKEATLVCPREGCEAKFKQVGTLRRHEKEFHLGLMVICSCPHCGRQFNRKSNLNAHLKIHEKNGLSSPLQKKRRCLRKTSNGEK